MSEAARDSEEGAGDLPQGQGCLLFLILSRLHDQLTPTVPLGKVGKEVWEFLLVLDVICDWLCFLMRTQPTQRDQMTQLVRKEGTRDLAQALQRAGEEGSGPGEGAGVSRKEDSTHSFI